MVIKLALILNFAIIMEFHEMVIFYIIFSFLRFIAVFLTYTITS
jgi:hypothetical protein